VGLPVELMRFDAKADGNAALLEWETATEANNRGFEVQHGTDANDWQVEGFVAGKGNSNTPAAYEFRVPDLPPGTHFFRLRQTDFDGSSTFTDVRSLEIRGKKFYAAFRPNTVNDVGELYLFSERPTSARVEIFNAAGQPLGIVRAVDLEQETVLPMELGHLPGGLYFAVVQTEGERVVVSFLKN